MFIVELIMSVFPIKDAKIVALGLIATNLTGFRQLIEYKISPLSAFYTIDLSFEHAINVLGEF